MGFSLRRTVFAALVCCMILLSYGMALAGQLVVNGGFETGDATGWTIVNAGSGQFSVMSGTTTPVSSHTVLPPPAGTYAAVTDQDFPSRQILYQDIAVPAGAAANFSATIYLHNYSLDWTNGPGLDYTGVTNQQFRVDIMNPVAAVDDVGTGVLLNVYQTQPGDPLVLGYTTISADLSPFAGQTVRIRFAEADNNGNLNAGVDQVSVVTSATAVPTMTQWGMILFMLLAGVIAILHLRRASPAN